MHGLATIKQLNQQRAEHAAEKHARSNHLAYDRAVDNRGELYPGFVSVFAEGEKRFEANIHGNKQRFDSYDKAAGWIRDFLRQGS
jgi:hypothetical protein